MKKTLTVIFAALALGATAQTEQPAKDTTVQITLTLNQLRAVLSVIDSNIDSKKVSKEVLEFLQSNTKLLNPPLTAPKK